jgi:hypothetical protein
MRVAFLQLDFNYERLPPLALSVVLARAQTGLGSRKFLRLLFQRV